MIAPQQLDRTQLDEPLELVKDNQSLPSENVGAKTDDIFEVKQTENRK